MPDPAYRRAGFSTPYAYEKARAEARSYAKDANGTYNQDVPRKAEAFGAYHRAFVSKATGVKAYGERNNSKMGGNKYMQHLLVNVLGVMTLAEFRAKYGKK